MKLNRVIAMASKKAHAGLIVASLLSSSLAFSDFFSAVRTSFRDFDGKNKRPLDFVESNSKFIIVSFWADWCVACKQEIEMLAANQSNLAKITVVTINVDEDGEFLQAKAYLKNKNISFPSLRDPGGTYFFTASPDGSLPYVVLFDRDGQFVRSYTQFHQSDLDEILQKTSQTDAQVDQSKESETTSKLFQHYVDFRAKVKTRRPQAPGENQSTVQTSHFQYSATYQSWDLKLSHHALMQRRPFDKEYLDTEDELGFTYLQWTSPSAKQEGDHFFTLTNARLGSDQKYLLNGLLLSVKSGPEETQNSRIDGLHLGFDLWKFDFKVFAGQIRNQLYPAILDPTVDMSKKLPKQAAAGASVGISGSAFDGELVQRFELGSVSLARKKDAEIGYVDDFKDQRTGVAYDLTYGRLALKNTATQYSCDQESDRGQAYYSELSIPLIDAFSTQVAASEINLKQDGYEYLSTPNLAGDYSRPLDALDRASRKVSINWDAPKTQGGPYLHLDYTQDHSLPLNLNDQQSWTTGLTAGLSEMSAKVRLVTLHQVKKSPAQNEVDESVLNATAPTGMKNLGLRAEHRRYRSLNQESTDKVTGERNGGGLQYRYDISNDFSAVAAFDFNQQVGFYQADSGLSKKNLRQYSLAIENEVLNASIRYGQEPGGIVCTTAGCSYRNGHDGILAELSVSHTL